jgi:hypothetical protein
LVKIFLKISLENLVRKGTLKMERKFVLSSWWCHHDDDEVIVSAFTNTDTWECAHCEQAHTHERVAERQLVVAKTNPPTERCTRCSLTIECSRGELISDHSVSRQRKIYFMFIFRLFFLWIHWSHPPGSAPMHVGDRSTWLNSEALSRDKDLFFEKKKIRLFSTTYRRINAVNSKGFFVLMRNWKFLEKKILEKSLEKKSWKKSWKYFSKEKSTELSHVERTPTCIVSLMLRFVVSKTSQGRKKGHIIY